MLQAHFDKAQLDATRSTGGEVEKLRVLKYNHQKLDFCTIGPSHSTCELIGNDNLSISKNITIHRRVKTEDTAYFELLNLI